MNETTYHVNPITGIPTICRMNGNCPNSEGVGEVPHFKSYSEAQIYALEMAEAASSQHLSSSADDREEMLRNIEAERKVKEEVRQQLPTGSDYEITKAIINTTDKRIVMGIIEGEILSRADWKYTSVALQNSNICKDFLNEALFKYPEEFTNTARRWLVLNQSLNHETLVSIIEDEQEDMEVRALAFRNRNLQGDYVAGILKTGMDRIYTLPYSMIIFSPYSNKETQRIYTKYQIFGNGESPDLSRASQIGSKFNTWDRIYRNEIAEEMSNVP